MYSPEGVSLCEMLNTRGLVPCAITGVGIAEDQESIAPNVTKNGLHGVHYSPGLHPVTQRAAAKVPRGPRDPELLEEEVRHLDILVLTCV